MTRKQDLLRLKELAQLALDHRLGRMRAATVSLEQSKAQLAAISEMSCPSDIPLVAGARAGLTYQRWVDHRRAELNLVIARQTAEWLGAREEARTAFGRSSALGDLARLGRSADK